MTIQENMKLFVVILITKLTIYCCSRARLVDMKFSHVRQVPAFNEIKLTR